MATLLMAIMSVQLVPIKLFFRQGATKLPEHGAGRIALLNCLQSHVESGAGIWRDQNVSLRPCRPYAMDSALKRRCFQHGHFLEEFLDAKVIEVFGVFVATCGVAFVK